MTEPYMFLIHDLNDKFRAYEGLTKVALLNLEKRVQALELFVENLVKAAEANQKELQGESSDEKLH